MHSENQTLKSTFLAARQQGLRAVDAAQSAGLTEGAALALFARARSPTLALPLSAPGLQVHALRPQWLDLLSSLKACGPLMALTRNPGVVHEKTGRYFGVSGSDAMGLVPGREFDLCLFFKRWAAGLLVLESAADICAPPRSSLQFFDARGVAVHKIFPVRGTSQADWQALVCQAVDAAQVLAFDPLLPPEPFRGAQAKDPKALASDWAAMTDTHQFFGLLQRHDVERLGAFAAVEGRFTRQVPAHSVHRVLQQANQTGLPLMVFVGNPGCIQIHTGPVRRVEPLEQSGKRWLNVLDPGFNLHLREDLIDQCWVVEKPTDDGVVTSLEVFDAQGQLMVMFFGERKPGQPELQAWRDALACVPTLGHATAAAA